MCRELGVLAIAMLCSISFRSSEAALKFYYDPATGIVSFDTSETRSGAVYTYGLRIRDLSSGVQFNSAKWVDLTTSTFQTVDGYTVGEGTFGNPMRGLLSIGAVLPPGLSSGYWQSFSTLSFEGLNAATNHHFYADVLGGGNPAPAELIYGAPGRPYDNNYDVVDPALLKWAETATLEYHAWNGELVLDTSGLTSGYISQFFVDSNGEFEPGYFRSPTQFAVKDIDFDRLYYITDAILPGRYNLGAVLPRGLSLSQLESTITSAKFRGRVGYQYRTGDFDLTEATTNLQIAYIAVPEPEALTILVIGALSVSLAGFQSRCIGARSG